jgi:tRNA(fMet)-specific endonuclease VapC
MSALRYLLDTNIVSDLIRNPSGVVHDCISRVGEESVCVSIVVAAELRFGARKRNSAKLTERVEAILDSIAVLPFEAPADLHYANIRRILESAGDPIGPNDLLIAAHARALDLTLVTASFTEFSRVPGLRVESWLG